jgi:hypothetical protein
MPLARTGPSPGLRLQKILYIVVVVVVVVVAAAAASK